MAFLRIPTNCLYYAIYCNNYEESCKELEKLAVSNPKAIDCKEIISRCLLYWHLDDCLLFMHSYSLPFSFNLSYVLSVLYEEQEYSKIQFIKSMTRYNEAEFLPDIVRSGNVALVQQLVPEYRQSFLIHTGEHMQYSRLLEIAEEVGGAVWEHLKSLDIEEEQTDTEPLNEEELLYGENEMLEDSEEDAHEPYYWRTW